MDGSEVTVVVLGCKEVGKTTFIAQCLDMFRSEVKAEASSTIHICGHDVRVRMVDNPELLTPAAVVIIVIDLTNRESFRQLPDTLEFAQKLSPTAVSAVVGAKADLYSNRKISTEEVVEFCQTWPQANVPLPYHETGLDPPDSILFAFQEILAKPLINEYVQLKVTTEPELSGFICEAMEWCLDNGSANILTHLRDLGYAIPLTLFDKYHDVLTQYLFNEYPPTTIPKFEVNDLSSLPAPVSIEDSMDEPEEPLSVVDSRPLLSISKSYLLNWKDISLSVFLRCFLSSPSLNLSCLAHIDLSHNKLMEVPPEMFRLPALQSLNISHNHISTLTTVDLWTPRSHLQYLNASHNSLAGWSTLANQRQGAEGSVPFKGVWNVNLSHNCLGEFPTSVLLFPLLRVLNLSGNPQIHKLPTQLHRMKHLMSLSVDTHRLTDPPPVVAKWGPTQLLHYLQLKARSCHTWNSMRVVVVGPKGAGKSHLVAKIKEEKSFPTGPTKGLEVSEWRHRSSDIFSFRSKWVTIDLWDFSGDPDYNVIYSCFPCSKSLHLVVCSSQNLKRSDLIRWLADIQSTSTERIPVIVVFTHIDQFPSREQKDVFRRQTLHWLNYQEKRFSSITRSYSFGAARSQSIKNLYGEELTTSHESLLPNMVPKEPLEVQDAARDSIPLMPIVHQVFFVNSLSGDGVGALRKCLLKIVSGSIPPSLTGFSGFGLIGLEVPSVYMQVEHLIRQLRMKFRSSRREGEQRPFYTVSELMYKKLKRPLQEMSLQENDFTKALSFLHEYGFVYLHHCHDPPSTLVSVDPQLAGFLLQRMIRAGYVSQEVLTTSCHLPNSHLFMLWGVEPIWSLEQDNDTIYSQHLLDFLYSLNLFSPLLPGLTILPSILPAKLPSDKCPSPSPTLQCRRVYIFNYMPTWLASQLTSRIISSFLITNGGFPSPISPGQAPPATQEIPFQLQSGLTLFAWRRNLFLKDTQGSELLVKMMVGREVSREAMAYEGRVDILLSAEAEMEAQWLRIVTTEIDYLLEHVYPCLLEVEQSGQLVEIFVPLPTEAGEEIDDAEEEEEEEEEEEKEVEEETVVGVAEEELEEEKEVVRGSVHNGDGEEGEVKMVVGGEEEEGESGEGEEVEKDGQPYGEQEGLLVLAEEAEPQPKVLLGEMIQSRSWAGSPNVVHKERVRVGSAGGGGGGGGGRRGRGRLPVRMAGSLPSHPSSLSSPGQRFLLEQTHDTSSWEVLSKQSSTSTRFSLKQDDSTSYVLIPVWECLQEAFKSPLVRVNHRKLYLNMLAPDLLFGDLPAELIFRFHGAIGDQYLNSLEEQHGIRPSQEASGLHVRSYYTSIEDEMCMGKAVGAMRMLCLKKCLQKAREDLEKLRSLQCPYVVSAIGVHFSPPSLAVESSPLGSLYHLLKGEEKGMVGIGSNNVHHILLQLLSALDYFHQVGLNYHTLCSEHVLLWSMQPVSVKLSDSGITHTSAGCELCSYVSAVPNVQRRSTLARRIDYVLLGLLIYEVATGKKPYEGVYSLNSVVLAIINRKLKLNVEAELSSVDDRRKTTRQKTVSCHRLCMQLIMDQCITKETILPSLIRANLSLCAGNHEWSPLRLTLNPECVLCSEDGSLVYWASGSRGLVTGTLEPSTGAVNSNILQEAPPPESGMFAHRRGKPVPIAIGRATVLTLVEETQQLWVGTENGLRGSVYVFKLPEMRRHNYIHLQDAVLSLAALNRTAVRYGGEEMKYRVLVGLANGTVIQFLGTHQGKVLENPLQGPKLVIHLVGRKPCLSLQLTSQGHVWCSSGDAIEVLDVVTLKSVRQLTLQAQGEEKDRIFQRGDVITLLTINTHGVWTVTRRSPILRLWNQESGNLIACYNVHNARSDNEDDITAIANQGRVIWLGTRNGYIYLLDAAAVVEGREDSLLGMKYCGEGRVKNIVPLVNSKKISAKMEVFCSLEFPDEVSGAVMTWEYQYQQQWRPRVGSPHTNSNSLPPSPLRQSLSPPHLTSQSLKPILMPKSI